jgi:hypothetical protein
MAKKYNMCSTVSSYLDMIDTDQVDKQYLVQLLGK